jgi:hypothetical protein
MFGFNHAELNGHLNKQRDKIRKERVNNQTKIKKGNMIEQKSKLFRVDIIEKRVENKNIYISTSL